MKTVDAQNFPGYETLLNIENNLGIFTYRAIPATQKRDAGKLIDAIRVMDRQTICKIAIKYQNELKKGDVQGGPKEVKSGDIIKRNLAHIALINRDRY